MAHLRVLTQNTGNSSLWQLYRPYYRADGRNRQEDSGCNGSPGCTSTQYQNWWYLPKRSQQQTKDLWNRRTFWRYQLLTRTAIAERLSLASATMSATEKMGHNGVESLRYRQVCKFSLSSSGIFLLQNNRVQNQSFAPLLGKHSKEE